MQVDNRPESGRANAHSATGQPEQDQAKPILRWPVALAVMVVALVILLGGGSLLVRQFTRPSSGPLGTVPASVATPAELATATPATTTAAAAAPPATQVAGAAAGGAATSAPTQQPTAAAGTPVSSASAPSGAAGPNTNQQLEAEVSAAYLRYWDARAQASLTLNPNVLDDVADGEELAALRQDIEKLRAEGRTIRGEVEHQYTVLQVEGDQAQVLDRFRDFSIYVDPVTKQPLSGETRPSPEDAPLSTVLYQLRREDTTWKVVDAQRYANQ